MQRYIMEANNTLNIETHQLTSELTTDEQTEMENLKQMAVRLKEAQMEKDLELTEANMILNRFFLWASTQDKITYNKFRSIFSPEFKTTLFNTIYQFFHHEMLTNEILFYWKLLIIDLVKSNKKYKSIETDPGIDEIIIDEKNHTINFKIIPNKSTFKCYIVCSISDEAIGYFKENGNDYYFS